MADSWALSFTIDRDGKRTEHNYRMSYELTDAEAAKAAGLLMTHALLDRQTPKTREEIVAEVMAEASAA